VIVKQSGENPIAVRIAGAAPAPAAAAVAARKLRRVIKFVVPPCCELDTD
jgi:hypothetical protein